MQRLTTDEQAAVDKAEKRRRMAARMRYRAASARGAIAFIDDLLAALPDARPRSRARIEPELTARKAHLLLTLRGITPLARFFRFAQQQLLSPILERQR